VAELSGHPIRAVEEPAVAHDRPADAGRDGDVQEVGAAPAGPERGLTEGRHVRVAVEERGQAERALDGVGERDVTEPRAEVGRLDDDTGARIDRARARQPDPAERSASRARRFGTSPFECVDACPDDGVGPLLGGCLERDPRQARAVRFDDGRPDLGPTQIERQDRS